MAAAYQVITPASTVQARAVGFSLSLHRRASPAWVNREVAVLTVVLVRACHFLDLVQRSLSQTQPGLHVEALGSLELSCVAGDYDPDMVLLIDPDLDRPLVVHENSPALGVAAIDASCLVKSITLAEPQVFGEIVHLVDLLNSVEASDQVRVLECQAGSPDLLHDTLARIVIDRRAHAEPGKVAAYVHLEINDSAEKLRVCDWRTLDLREIEVILVRF